MLLHTLNFIESYMHLFFFYMHKFRERQCCQELLLNYLRAFFFPLLNVLPKAAYNHLKLKRIFYGLLNRVFLYNSWWLFAILVLWNEVICYHLIYTISRIGHAVDAQGHGFHIIVKFWT